MIGSLIGAIKMSKLFAIIWGGMFGGMPWAFMVLPTLTQNVMYLITYIIGIISIAVLILFAKIMPKRTPFGNEMLGKLRGFKRFLETAEKPQLEALVNENPEYLRKGMFDWTEEEENSFYNTNIEDFAKKLKPIEDSSYYIKKLKEDGHKIYIITGRNSGRNSEPHSKPLRIIHSFQKSSNPLTTILPSGLREMKLHGGQGTEPIMSISTEVFISKSLTLEFASPRE